VLLCLDREQRLTYILGGIFGVTDAVAAELPEITCENFRQRLGIGLISGDGREPETAWRSEQDSNWRCSLNDE
jgi:hypothetical protein